MDNRKLLKQLENILTVAVTHMNVGVNEMANLPVEVDSQTSRYCAAAREGSSRFFSTRAVASA